jgi:hypothetical protein
MTAKGLYGPGRAFYRLHAGGMLALNKGGTAKERLLRPLVGGEASVFQNVSDTSCDACRHVRGYRRKEAHGHNRDIDYLQPERD